MPFGVVGWVAYRGFPYPWLWLIVTVVVGIILYVVRYRYRVIYGVGEILVSWLIMFITYFPRAGSGAGVTGNTPSLLEMAAVQLLPVAVTLYLFVQGCEDVREGYTE